MCQMMGLGLLVHEQTSQNNDSLIFQNISVTNVSPAVLIHWLPYLRELRIEVQKFNFVTIPSLKVVVHKSS